MPDAGSPESGSTANDASHHPDPSIYSLHIQTTVTDPTPSPPPPLDPVLLESTPSLIPRAVDTSTDSPHPSPIEGPLEQSPSVANHPLKHHNAAHVQPSTFFNYFLNYHFAPAAPDHDLSASPPHSMGDAAAAAAALASAIAGAQSHGGAVLKPRGTEGGFGDEERREMVLFTLFCAIGIVIGYLEASGVFNAPYSKFRKERWSTLGYMSTRLGMFIINASTLLLILSLYLFYGDPSCPFHLVTLGFYCVFYMKRIAEGR
ncbi:hypothetical protein HDU67_001373 [Dinochytrium kinnereticum]|nr:hypothetical protein HDU67_001373 [Dinochytrium kinnereticum]